MMFYMFPRKQILRQDFGQREELNCNIVTTKALADPRKFWKLDGPLVFVLSFSSES